MCNIKKISAWSEGYNRGYLKAIIDIKHYLDFNDLTNDNESRIKGIAATRNCIDTSLKILESNPRSREKFKEVGGRVRVNFTVNDKGNTDKNSKFYIYPRFEKGE